MQHQKDPRSHFVRIRVMSPTPDRNRCFFPLVWHSCALDETRTIYPQSLWGQTSTEFSAHAQALGCRAPPASLASPWPMPWGEPWLPLLALQPSALQPPEEKVLEETQRMRLGLAQTLLPWVALSWGDAGVSAGMGKLWASCLASCPG